MDAVINAAGYLMSGGMGDGGAAVVTGASVNVAHTQTKAAPIQNHPLGD